MTNFEKQKYYQNKSKFNGVYSKTSLPKIKDGIYVINLHEYKSMGTNWAAIIVLNDIVTYFDSLGVKFIPQEIEKFIGNKNITTMMCGYLCIGFINFML